VLAGAVAAAASPAAALAQSALAPSALAQSAVAPPVLAPPVLADQAPKLDDTVGAGFTRGVIARWGDDVIAGAAAFSPARLTPGQAEAEFPYDGVIAGLLAAPAAQDGVPRRVMVLANPAAPAGMVFPGGVDDPAVAGRLQGGTVLNLQYLSGRWLTVDGGYQCRRLTDGTLCRIAGPAAAAIGATVQGILAPQGGCATPWGTALFAEGDAAPWLRRLAGTGLGYGDPAQAPRFGWIVELDPLDPGAIPVKRTALGRFARAAVAATRAADGRAVIFMSQDAAAGYFFRFIAAGDAAGGELLDAGQLAVARTGAGGIGWVDLGTDLASLAGTLAAAAAAGGSVFDSPGGIAVGPDGTVYLACGGNAARPAADALNPRVGDDNGHVLALRPAGGDAAARVFAGAPVILAGQPGVAPGTGYAAGSTAWFTRPRTLNLDAAGQLWIGTDQGGKISATADGLFVMPTAGAARYRVAAAYLAPVGAAVGGAAFDAGTRTVFAMVRHPGATPGASFDNPATRWPTLAPGMPPQSTLIGLAGLPGG
jgi:secreted PhoX family phosphatase